MTKRILLFLSAILVCFNQHAFSDEEIPVAKGSVYHYNSVFKNLNETAYKINYTPDEKKIFFYFIGYGLSDADCISFDKEQRDKLVECLDKFQAWNKKALSQGVTLQKVIGTFEARGIWELNKEWRFGSNGDISAVFFSQNKKTHQFVLNFPKFVSDSNQFDTEQPDDLYFSAKGAKILSDQLSDETIEAAVKKFNKTKKITDEFK